MLSFFSFISDCLCNYSKLLDFLLYILFFGVNLNLSRGEKRFIFILFEGIDINR